MKKTGALEQTDLFPPPEEDPCHPGEPFPRNQEDQNERFISEADAHFMSILSEYITSIPDYLTRKHIARALINKIIESARL